jgi:hypothetical protein
MKFQRFGNAFAAHDEFDTLYVVSFYCGAWSAYYQLAGHDEVVQIGQYGYPTPEEATQAAEAFAVAEAGAR